MSKSCISK
ncbi:hypothetical protein, partial [Klebsiella phage vB_KpnM_TU02]